MDIPGFPDFKSADLSFQGVVNDYLSRHPLEASEYTFTNIFAYRVETAYNFKLSLLENNIIILKDSEPVSAFCPVGDSGVLDVLHEMFEYLGTDNKEPYLERVPGSFVSRYLKNNKDFIIEEDRDQFDYLYNVRELAELRGRRFHDKKNLTNKFRNRYEYEYLSLTHDLVGECLAFEDYWCEVRECEKHSGLKRERCAILEMLKNFRALNIKGGAIRTGGKIAAITLGEKFLHNTFVIHVEKANPDIPGLYQVINQEFLMHEAGGCSFVNREQDVGENGLRKAKLSYNPVDFVKKYIIRKRVT